MGNLSAKLHLKLKTQGKKLYEKSDGSYRWVAKVPHGKVRQSEVDVVITRDVLPTRIENIKLNPNDFVAKELFTDKFYECESITRENGSYNLKIKLADYDINCRGFIRYEIKSINQYFKFSYVIYCAEFYDHQIYGLYEPDII